jgi:hypothetical protein
MNAVEEGKQFLEHVKRLTEIQKQPDVFKSVTSDQDGTRLMFWAGSGQYTMLLRETPDAVQVTVLRDSVTYRVWSLHPDGSWHELQTGEGSSEFAGDREAIARTFVESIGSRLPVS